MGLRERKKERTRRGIADAAQRLFADRGFDGVTVAQVARDADVAEATVFNYFPTKEDLFYSGLEVFGAGLVAAVAGRPAGTSVLAAVREVLVRTEGGRLDRIAAGDREALAQMRTTARIIADSVALRRRELQVLAEVADALAGVVAAEAGTRAVDGTPDAVSSAVAHALMGVHRALVDLARRRLLADERPIEIAADVRAAGEEAFALLERGLAATPAAG